MNKFETRSKRSYDKKADNYDNTFDGKFTVKFKKKLYDAVVVDEDAIVADIACGNGRLLQMLAGKASFQGCGVDISDKMIEQAKSLNPTMKFFVAGCDNLPFENCTVGTMTVCASYHHFPDVEKFAKEASRVIKQGGSLYIAEVYFPAALRILCNPFIKLSKAGDVKFYAPKEITSLFENYGFTVKSVNIDGIIQVVELQRK